MLNQCPKCKGVFRTLSNIYDGAFFWKVTAEIRSVFSHKACIIEDSKSASKMCLKLAGKAPELHHSCVVFYLRQINTFNWSIYWVFFRWICQCPNGIFLFEVNSEICSKLTKKYVGLVSLLLTLNRFYTLF